MLTADQIEVLGEQARQITDPIVEFLIQDIARRVSEAGQLTSTASYQVWRLQQLGFSQRQLKKELRKRLKVSHRELRKLLTQAAEVGYDFDIRHLPYVQAVPFQSNEVVQSIVEAMVDMARSDLTNMVQTLGFVNHDGVCRPLTEAYEQACDFAFQKVAFGAQDYNSAVRGAVRELAAKGIQTIDYESGVHTSLEAAVRRNVMGGLGLMQERISQQNHDDLGCDGWEISAHAASAPDHEPIQGKQYSDAQYTALNNSLVRRIGTLNCGHAAFPIILGVNSPQYTPEELENFRRENEKGVEYGGKHFTLYEATQHQRKLERAIRKRKKKILLDEGLHDEQRLAQDQTKLVRLNEEYARFTKAAGLRSQRERTMVAGFGKKQAAQARAVNAKPKATVEQAQKPLAITEKNDILRQETGNNEVSAVQYVTRLDKDKYRCVSQDIVTDEVIITDERIKHIMERHPDDYERFSSYLSRIIEEPDYILEDKHPATALVMKQIEENGERFRLTLRLVTSSDNPEYKNSIITFLKIREKEWNRLVKNKKMLYKAE